MRYIYLFSSTHWDREWYRPFQGFRYKLVKTVTQIVEILEENPEFSMFFLDGQTIVLEDYLEIRPEMRERLERLIQTGRLKIGPWYCMPDEQLISGESLIKNLLRGRQISQSLGTEPWAYGYICDIFSHTPQMPQIFNGFSIIAALLGRGTNEESTPMHFSWESPNGSRCITFKLPDYMLYGDFTCRAVMPYANCKTDAEKDTLLKAEVDAQWERTDQNAILLMDGLDHMPIHTELLEIRERLCRLYPDATVIIGDPSEMAQKLDKSKLLVRTGQLLEPAQYPNPAQRTILHTQSSRYDIKYDNDKNQILLEKWMAPMRMWAKFHGLNIFSRFEYVADTYLLKNHPHDSICGCSVDAVHADMLCRGRQIQAICAEVLTEIKHHIRKDIPICKDSNDIAIELVNPLPYFRRELVTVEIPFFSDFPYTFSEEPHGFEPINAFVLLDAEENEVPYTREDILRNSIRHNYEEKYYNGDTYVISFVADLPPMGVVWYRIAPPQNKLPAVRDFGSMMTGLFTAENKYIAFSISENGTLTIADKRTGREYCQLLSYLDNGELGDGWNSVAPVCDRKISSIGSKVSRELLNDSTSELRMRIVTHMEIPEALDTRKKRATGYSRSDRTTMIKIESTVTLGADNDFLLIDTKIYNSAQEHRLCALFPTGINTPVSIGSQPFAFVEQNNHRNPETARWNQPDFIEKPTSGIVLKQDAGGNGLSIISAYGIHEYADLPGGILSLTMLRSISKTVFTDGEPDGMLLGNHHYRFAIRPVDANTRLGELYRLQERISTGVESAYVQHFSGMLPAAESLFCVSGDPEICYSTFKESADGKSTVLRIFNTVSQPHCAKINLNFPISAAYCAALSEDVLYPLNIEQQSLTVTVPAYGIYTILFQ